METFLKFNNFISLNGTRISFGTLVVVELETIRANFHDSIIKTFIIRADAPQNNKIQVNDIVIQRFFVENDMSSMKLTIV